MTGLNYAAGGEASLVVVVRQGRALNLAAPCRVGEPVLGEIHPVGLAPCAARKPHGSRCGAPPHHPLPLTLIHHRWTPMPLRLSRNLAVRCQRRVRPVLLHLWFPSAEDAPSNKPRTHTFATIPNLKERRRRKSQPNLAGEIQRAAGRHSQPGESQRICRRKRRYRVGKMRKTAPKNSTRA